MRRKIDRKDEFYVLRKKAFRQLLRMPHAGDVCEFDTEELAGLRMWPVRGFENYVIFFRPTTNGIEVIRVLHAAQDFPSIFEPESGS